MRLPGVTRGAIEGAGAGRDGPLESPPGALGAAESAGVIVGGGPGGIGGGSDGIGDARGGGERGSGAPPLPVVPHGEMVSRMS